jgi:transcriptional regulator with XRE-family HTH domain
MLIKHIRQQKGLSLRALAAQAKMSYTYLCNVENGKADPSLSTLRNLAKALGVVLIELLTDEQPRSVNKSKVQHKSGGISPTKKGR